MEKVKGIVVVILIALICTACTANAQLNERIIVKAVGIDKGTSHNYDVSVQYFNASGSGSTSSVDNSKSNVLTAYGSGNTVEEALLNASSINGKILLLEQNDIIIVGNELLKSNMNDVFDFYKKQNLHTLVATANRQAKDIIDVKFKEGSASTEKLKYIFKNANRYGLCKNNTLLNVYTGLANGNIFLPQLTVEKNKTDTSEDSENVKLQYGILINNNGYIELNDDDMKALSILTDETRKLVVPIKDESHTLDFNLTNLSTRVKPVIRGEELHFLVDIRATGHVLQDNAYKSTETYEKLAVTELNSGIIRFIERCIKDDCFLFAELSDIVRHSDYKLWKQIQNDLLAKLKNSTWEICTSLDSGNTYYSLLQSGVA